MTREPCERCGERMHMPTDTPTHSPRCARVSQTAEADASQDVFKTRMAALHLHTLMMIQDVVVMADEVAVVAMVVVVAAVMEPDEDLESDRAGIPGPHC